MTHFWTTFWPKNGSFLTPQKHEFRLFWPKNDIFRLRGVQKHEKNRKFWSKSSKNVYFRASKKGSFFKNAKNALLKTRKMPHFQLMHSGTLVNINSQKCQKNRVFRLFGDPQKLGYPQKMSFFGQKSQISCFGGSKNDPLFFTF